MNLCSLGDFSFAISFPFLFLNVSIQVEFATGQSVATISLTIRDDDIAELQEVTYIQLTQIVDAGTNLPGRGAIIGMVIIIVNQSVTLNLLPYF